MMNRRILLIAFLLFISNICFGDYIKEKIHNGQWLVLGDGSMWEVAPQDRFDLSLWLSTSEVAILNNDNGSFAYDYLLVNTDNKEKVHVKPMNITNRHWLRAIENNGTILILDDGSSWQVDSFDTNISNFWSVSSDIYVVEDASGIMLINAGDGKAVHVQHIDYMK